MTALSAAAGSGTVAATLTLDDAARTPHVVAKLDFHAIDPKHFAASDSLLQETGRFTGQAHLDATGASLAQMLSQGQGALKFTMSQGDMTLFLSHLPGVELVDPVIAALHLRTSTPIRCMAGDFILAKGALTSRVLVIETSAGTFLGRGGIDMRDERIDYRIAPAPSSLPFGSPAGPIDIKGTLRHPVVAAAPDAAASSGLTHRAGHGARAGRGPDRHGGEQPDHRRGLRPRPDRWRPLNRVPIAPRALRDIDPNDIAVSLVARPRYQKNDARSKTWRRSSFLEKYKRFRRGSTMEQEGAYSASSPRGEIGAPAVREGRRCGRPRARSACRCCAVPASGPQGSS